MARLSVAQGPCSAVLPTVHGCHYAFQKFPVFCVTLYFVCDVLNILLRATRHYNFVNDNISTMNPVSANIMLDLLFFGVELHYTIIQGIGKGICERMNFVDDEMRRKYRHPQLT